MKIRRVVMGHDPEGRSVVLADEAVEPVTLSLFPPGTAIHRAWELDGPPALPVTDVPPSPVGTPFFPGPGGIRCGFLTVPPGMSYEPPAGVDLQAAMAEMEEKMPGLASSFDPSRPGMHTTATTDFIVVVAGEGRMQTDDGVEVRLSAGDCLIQNGTAHAWFNDGPEPLVVAFTLFGAMAS
ncbi:MAG: cupin domain-containing protein [Actinomycetota bacterium]|jgi:mannose-6-phosphate isomerase-like protein (cupin superfamily)